MFGRSDRTAHTCKTSARASRAANNFYEKYSYTRETSLKAEFLWF